MNLLYLFASYLKTEILSFLALVAGWVFGLALLFQANDSSAWYPIIISTVGPALVTSLFLFISEYLKRRAEKQKEQEAQIEKDRFLHLSKSEKLAELSQSEINWIVGEIKGQHQKEIKFLKYQIEIEKVVAFEARQRYHALANDLNIINGHLIKVIHPLLSHHKIEIPEFSIKTNEERDQWVEQKVAEFKQKLEKEKENIIRLTE